MNMMPAIQLHFTTHAKTKMVEREFQSDHIRKAINNPDFFRRLPGGETLVRKRIDEERTVEVIYFKDKFRKTNTYRIITVYYKGKFDVLDTL